MTARSSIHRPSLARKLAAGAMAGAVALTAAGCGGEQTETGEGGSAEPTPVESEPGESESTEPSAAQSQAEANVVEIEFADGEVTPNGERIEVGVGEPIELQVTADQPGELHMHASQEQTFAYGVGTESFEIQIDRPGVVVVESHDLDQVIVQLEVR